MQGASVSDELSVEKIIVVPPDGGWGWVVVVAAFTCILVMDGISNSFALFIPVFQKEFKASVAQISLVNSLFTGFYYIFGPVAGSLANRFGFRPVIIAGSFVSSFGLVVTIFFNSIQIMFVTYGLIGGIGFSMMYINVILTVGFYFEKWRALATGITVSGSGVGTLIFAPVVQILLHQYTWRQVFVGYSCLVFLCSFVAFCFRPLAPIAIEESHEGEGEGEKSKKAGRKISSMHNTRYPTAAKAIDLDHIKGSKLATKQSRLDSVESLELLKDRGLETIHSGRNSPTKRRTTDFSEFQSFHDLTVDAAGSARFRLNNVCGILSCGFSSCCRLQRLRGCFRRKKNAGMRPLYRDDIFYEGSVSQLPVYDRNSTLVRISGSQPSNIAKSSLLYHLSVSRLPTHHDLQEERDDKCHWFPESMTRALKTMFDFRVMNYRLFLLFTVSTCFLSAGVNVPCYFTYVRAVGLGVMTEKDAALILSAIGISNTVGRVLCGIIASVPRMNIIILHFGFLLFGAVINAFVVFLHTKEAFFIYSALYGLVLAEQGSLRSVIIVKLVGLENLTNAFGILLLFLGLFTVVGTPSAGYITELTETYDSVFFFSSFALCMAAVTLIPIFVGKLKLKKPDENEPTQNLRTLPRKNHSGNLHKDP